MPVLEQNDQQTPSTRHSAGLDDRINGFSNATPVNGNVSNSTLGTAASHHPSPFVPPGANTTSTTTLSTAAAASPVIARAMASLANPTSSSPSSFLQKGNPTASSISSNGLSQLHQKQLPSSSSSSPPVRSSRINLDASLVPFGHSSKAAFQKALHHDRKAALQPDYQIPFSNAEDVVGRLLPYHVWQINDADLRYAMRAISEEGDDDDDDRGEGSSNGIMAKPQGRKRGMNEVMKADEETLQRFPSIRESERLWSRYSKIHARAAKLRYHLTGGVEMREGGSAPFAMESLYQLSRLVKENESRQLAEDIEKLRVAREQAVSAGIKWEELVRVGAADSDVQAQYANYGNPSSSQVAPSTPSSFQRPPNFSHPNHPSFGRPNTSPTKSSGGGPSAPSSPYSPYMRGEPPQKISKPRGRPRKDRSLPRQVPSTNTPITSPSRMPAVQPNRPFSPQLLSSARPPGVGTSAAQSVSPPGSSSIPSHPIPLVLPLSTLSRLSALGIAPVPAPHLLPAIAAQQAHAAAIGAGKPPPTPPSGGHTTTPRPAPPDQREPALLMGITEAPLQPSQRTSSSAATQQMLHVSVVLSKLNPTQLAGLASLMQSLQSQPSSPSSSQGTIPASASTTSLSSGTVNTANTVNTTNTAVAAAAAAGAASAGEPKSGLEDLSHKDENRIT